jgi:hypothetical protein
VTWNNNEVFIQLFTHLPAGTCGALCSIPVEPPENTDQTLCLAKALHSRKHLVDSQLACSKPRRSISALTKFLACERRHWGLEENKI